METLKTYLKDKKVKQSRLAAEVGISCAYMSQLVSGQRLPSIQVAAKISAATGGSVTISSWVVVTQTDAN
ncbi:helix-turn-helix transcriptional regulator [Thioclava sp. BHET1]|nr:helix-turn-helix transcriptional regulator [Thioclava sp. BHET1]